MFLILGCATTLEASVQEMSGWSDKTVCRLVESDTGAVYAEEAISRDLACSIPIKPTYNAKSYIRIKFKF